LPTSISNANTKSKKTQRLIEQAWQLRFQQQNAEAELALEELEKSLNSLGQELQWEIRLLRVSILRAKGQMCESNRELSEVGTEIFSKTRRAPFQYYFQKAINVFVTDDFSVAMEFFLLAESSAPNANMRLSCLMNVLTCLENLSLPWNGTLEEIEKILSQMKKKTKKAEIP
jgi:ATP/maltotriose-dependent transcriptional regulator MalT